MGQRMISLSDKEIQQLQRIIDSIEPFFKISDHYPERWVLWLDFLLEVQSKLMMGLGEDFTEDFAFRCADNFKALRKTLFTLAQNNIDTLQLQSLSKAIAICKDD